MMKRPEKKPKAKPKAKAQEKKPPPAACLRFCGRGRVWKVQLAKVKEDGSQLTPRELSDIKEAENKAKREANPEAHVSHEIDVGGRGNR